MPKAWRGAALQDGSSIGWQQAAPRTSRGAAVPWAVVSSQRNRGDGQNIALSHSREPPASQPIELPSCKAAPLQALGHSTRHGFAIVLCSFLTLKGPAFWVKTPGSKMT